MIKTMIEQQAAKLGFVHWKTIELKSVFGLKIGDVRFGGEIFLIDRGNSTICVGYRKL